MVINCSYFHFNSFVVGNLDNRLYVAGLMQFGINFIYTIYFYCFALFMYISSFIVFLLFYLKFFISQFQSWKYFSLPVHLLLIFSFQCFLFPLLWVSIAIIQQPSTILLAAVVYSTKLTNYASKWLNANVNFCSNLKFSP